MLKLLFFSFYFVLKTLRYIACYILCILTIRTLWKTKTSHDINLCIEACRSQTCWNSNQADIRKYVIYVALNIFARSCEHRRILTLQNWIFLRWNCFTFSKKYQWPNFIKTIVNDTTTHNHQFVYTVGYKVECYIKKTKSTCLLWKIRELVLSCSKPRNYANPTNPTAIVAAKTFRVISMNLPSSVIYLLLGWFHLCINCGKMQSISDFQCPTWESKQKV